MKVKEVEKEVDGMVNITVSRMKGICEENGLDEKGATMLLIFFIKRMVEKAWKGQDSSEVLKNIATTVKIIDFKKGGNER
jgi:hypothetical protein